MRQSIIQAQDTTHARETQHNSDDTQPTILGREPFVQNVMLLPADLWPELSARERELVKLILAGHPTASIAQKRGIAGGTVKNHRLHIYKKLDITTERELFLQYIERGVHNNQIS